MRDVRREAAGAADDTQLTPLWRFYPIQNVKILKWTPEGWEIRSTDETVTGVAQKSTVLGEGAERVVYHFRHVGERGRFLRFSPLVAKEGRFKEDLLSKDPLDFHKIFCKTQFTAQQLAKVFNARLAKIPGVTQVRTTLDLT